MIMQCRKTPASSKKADYGSVGQKAVLRTQYLQGIVQGILHLQIMLYMQSTLQIILQKQNEFYRITCSAESAFSGVFQNCRSRRVRV